MRFLDAAESVIAFQVLGNTTDASLELRVDFSEFLDRSASLARLVLDLIGTEQPAFLWMREFGVWPSLENWDLFNALRSASGLTGKSLAETPGHEFDHNDIERASSYLQLMFLSGWGGVIIGRKNQQRIAISHDSWLSIKPSLELSAQKTRVDEFGLSSRMEKAPQSLLA